MNFMNEGNVESSPPVRLRMFIRRKGRDYSLEDEKILGNLDYFLPKTKTAPFIIGSNHEAEIYIKEAAGKHARLQINRNGLYIEPLTEILLAFENRRGMRRATEGKIFIPLSDNEKSVKSQIKVANTHILCQIDPVLEDVQSFVIQRLGKGKKLLKIGEGLIANAYRTDEDNPKAIKIIKDQYINDGKNFNRFMRSGLKAVECKHPGLMQTYEVEGEEQKGLFIRQEYIDGELLHNYLYRNGRLADNVVFEILRQLGATIVYLARQGIVHRDINPRNIIITPEYKVKLLGLSLIKCKETEEVFEETQVVGTFNYIAPEQINYPQEVDYRADIFSFGAIAYTLLTGFPPYRASSIQEYVDRIENFSITPLSKAVKSLPPVITKFVDRSLSIDRNVRLNLDDLEHTLGDFKLFPFTSGESPQVWKISQYSQIPRGVSTRRILKEEFSSSIQIHERSFKNRYQFNTILGHGGMGTVYEAFDTVLQRKVAVKAVPKGNIADVLKEARIASTFFHSNLIPVIDYFEGEVDGQSNSFVVMEYMSGKDLATAYEDKALPLQEAIRIIKSILGGLSYLHSRDLVHRDIKPSNIFLTQDGESKLGDFGGVITSGKSGQFFGTPEYASPEQFNQKEIDCRSDIYSLGITIYELVTRRLPFRGQGFMNFMSKHLLSSPQPPKELVSFIPECLNQLILKMLEKEPANRYQNVLDVQTLLEDAEKDILEGIKQDNGKDKKKGKKDKIQEILNQAELDCSLGELDKGIQEYLNALELDPDNPQLCSALGDAYYAQGEDSQAMEWYRQAEELDPTKSINFQKLGDIFEKQGQNEDALYNYEQAAQRDPYNDGLQLSLEHFYELTGDRERALLKAQNLALKRLDRNHPIAVYFREKVLGDEDNKDFIATIKQVREFEKERNCRGLLNCFYSIDWEVRTEAARVLGYLKLPEATGGLLMTLGSEPDEDVRAEIFKAIGLIGDPESIPGLIQGFLHESSNVQDIISDVIAGLGNTAIQPLVNMLHNVSLEKRRDILLTIGKTGKRSFIPKIIPYIRSRETDVAKAAVKALGMLGGFSAYWTLQKMCLNPFVKSAVRHAASEAKGECFKKKV